ncbi:MAG TPA: FkbM family methyltransferase [Candidatus Acidoferrum sp.]|nr:FkbM family methyltransferase [Candidatus Acidoferrum sp.]
MWLSWQSHIIYTLGIYEPGLIRLQRAIVKPGDFCIDAGAHLGYLTLFLSQLVGDSGRVASFEPVPENFRVLQENVRINHADNIDLQNVALLDSAGPIKLARVAQQTLSWSTSAVNRSGEPRLEAVESRAITLDEFMAGAKRSPKFIKIDVEGAELLVLRGAAQTLQAAKPLLFLEIHNWGSAAAEEVLSYLPQLGYYGEIIGHREGEAFCLAVPIARRALLKEIRMAARV